MWYFSWILGIFAALALGVINVMWFEAQDAFRPEEEHKPHGKPTAH